MDTKLIVDSIIQDEDGTIREIQVVLDAIHNLQKDDTDNVGIAPAMFNQFLSNLCFVNPMLRKIIVSLLCMTSARQTENGLRFDELNIIDRFVNELSRYNFDAGINKEMVLNNMKLKLSDNMTKTVTSPKTENYNGSIDDDDNFDDNYTNYDNYVEYADDFDSPQKPLVVGYPDDDRDFIAPTSNDASLDGLEKIKVMENVYIHKIDNEIRSGLDEVHKASEEESLKSPVPGTLTLEIRTDHGTKDSADVPIVNSPGLERNQRRSVFSKRNSMAMVAQGTFLTGVQIETNEYNSKPVNEILDIHSPTKPVERRPSLKTNRRLELKRDCNFIPKVIYDMLDALREKAQVAEEVIITADEHWRQRMILSLEESLGTLKERHRKEQQGVIDEYKVCMGEYTKNIMSFANNEGNCKITKERKEFLDSLDKDKQVQSLANIITEKKDTVKSRYRSIRSSLVKRQQNEVENTTKALVATFTHLDVIRNTQLQNIHSALRKAEKATEHCIPLAENAHKAPYNKVLRNRADHGIQSARIAIAHGMELVAIECSKIRKNYKAVLSTGPIEHCLTNPTRPSSAYPGLIFAGRLPAMPSCFVKHKPSGSKRPATGMTRYLKKYESLSQSPCQIRARPKSAPTLTSSKALTAKDSSCIKQDAPQQRPISSNANAQNRPISATGFKIKTRMQALREAAQQHKLENDKEYTTENENDIDDEIYDEEFDSDEDKVFEDSIAEMQKSKIESQNREKSRKVKKKKKRIKKVSRSTITDSYDALVLQSICPHCKRKYFGDGKAIPSISSLDRHVSSTMRVKEIVGKRESIDLLTKKEREDHERRERNKKIYNMKVEKIEKFCSWECVKEKSLVAVPKAYRYEVFQLIDLFAGYIVN